MVYHDVRVSKAVVQACVEEVVVEDIFEDAGSYLGGES
jgi:hypothetical protein